MFEKSDKEDFLFRLRQALICGRDTTAEATESFLKQRKIFFEDLKQWLRIDPFLKNAFDQLLRDRKIVVRRYHLLAEKVGRINAEDFGKEQERSIRDEAYQVAEHSRLVCDASDKMLLEMQMLKESLDQIGDMMESYGGIGESTGDMYDTEDDDADDHID